ncbi:MAG: hypothetical protein QOJ99_557 [Bryobacterales bacterium]|jgi:hypothetical protein|nr:hypothetical protein [Bryobacterales bacterium]
MADAGITAWDSKRHYFFWRAGHSHSGGEQRREPANRRRPALAAVNQYPPYPDYTSGANNVTGAATGILALFFGTDRLTFSPTSAAPQVLQKTRTYDRFSDLAQDVLDVRIYEGIHFRFADTGARRQGRLVTRWAFRHFLRPVNNDHNDVH